MIINPMSTISLVDLSIFVQRFEKMNELSDPIIISNDNQNFFTIDRKEKRIEI